MLLTGGNVHDVVEAETLVVKTAELATAANVKIDSITADKGYDSKAVVEVIEGLGARAVIPSLSNRKHPRAIDWSHYKNRNLVERFFARLKHFRRAATRYDKLAARFLSFLHLASALIWLA